MSHLRLPIAPLALHALLLLASCERSHYSAGSESHFLATCLSDEQCGPLFCITGMCTKPCTADRECGGFADDGACVSEQPGASASASQQICSVECSRDAECSAIGEGLRCSAGQCSTRTPTAVPPGAIAGSGGAGGSTRDPVRMPAAGATSPPPTVLDPSTGAPVTMAPVGPVGGVGCRESPFMGDEACLPPPPAGEGIQIHLGPADYGNADELRRWLLQPGEEKAHCVTYPMPNADEFVFAEWEFSARPGLHGSIHLLDKSGELEICVSPAPDWGAVPELITTSRVRIERVAAAPENAAIGRAIPARAPASSWLHQFNFTDQPLLIELWFNLYSPRQTPFTPDAPFLLRGARVTPIEAGSDAVFSCAVDRAGRLLSLTPLSTPNVPSFDAYLVRASGERVALLHRDRPVDADATQVPATFRYDSVTKHPPIAGNGDGAFSGVVEVAAGDRFEWGCLIDNTGTAPLTIPSPQLQCDLAGASTDGFMCSE